MDGALGLVVGSLWAMSVEAGSGTQIFWPTKFVGIRSFCVCVCMGFFSLFAVGFVHGNLCSRPDPVWWTTLFIQRKEHTSCNNNNTLSATKLKFSELCSQGFCACALCLHTLNCSHTFVGLLKKNFAKNTWCMQRIYTLKKSWTWSHEKRRRRRQRRRRQLSAADVLFSQLSQCIKYHQPHPMLWVYSLFWLYPPHSI
jgi:hypothetical protein